MVNLSLNVIRLGFHLLYFDDDIVPERKEEDLLALSLLQLKSIQVLPRC